MKTSLIALLWVVAASMSAPASAQVFDRARLRAAATGQTVVVDRASFRLMPAAVVRLAEATRDTAATQSPRSTQTSANAPVARVDRYAIYLDTNGAADAVARTTRSAASATVVAALETRSGQPALLGTSIKLFDTTPAIARALATRTGGRLLYASATDGSAMIGYDSAMTALDNCCQLQGSNGVGAIKPEVIVPAARPL
ncbi:hypothetical protein [Xanthomonas citri]|uniref:hypothetical protein n=1 Tax=Xanthomonas citri TaxID=346 RepID=UPI0001CED767|nr:hypothetical protein [Xanthomonas citri]AMU98087.1 hypothetical protein TP37_08245 [Xanthomonas citri pv. aurantifolii]AMV02987.1 hypothetical protein TP50_11425 [Xanthomonas citri pv. aurantifolii]EFF48281.1 conserved hypothetical protein [Xanthomonas citri pv. aurantifolii str. ICPB 10535]MCC8491626.1 hypothetical protein [Xanthomonas citri pv. fuscans]TBW93414.1 hypothetical protein TP47_21235 [Xanthomonas citri pv. aurantifolii]